MHTNVFFISGSAAQDFVYKEKDELKIIDGTLAGERTVLVDGEEKQFPFYLPVFNVGKGACLAERIGKMEIKAGQAIIVQAALEYQEWKQDDEKRSTVKVRILSLEKIKKGETATDNAGGKRLKNAQNHGVITGNLVNTPELKETKKGDKYTSLTVAIDASWKDKSGNDKEKIHFVTVKLWRGAAKAFMSQKPEAGMMVVVTGAANNESWTDKKSEKKRYSVAIVGESAHVLDVAKSEIKIHTLPSAAAQASAERAELDDDDSSPF